MRTLVVGAGAVGGYFGARLARGGADVTLVARGEHGRVIRESGLRVQSPSGDFDVRVPVIESIADARGFDLALVAVKGAVLAAVARDLRPALTEAGIALTVLNGLTSEDVLAASLGVARVVGGTALVGGERVAPGVVRHDARGLIVVGEPWPPGAGHAERVARFLGEHGVSAQVTSSLAEAKWWKMAWNCAWNSITAAWRCTVGEVGAREPLRVLAAEIVAEVAAVARAAGVALSPDIFARLALQNSDIGHIRTSMLQDVEAGRPSENEDLCGEIVRRGRALGVPTPACARLHAAIAAIERAAATSASR
ncbi:MAG: 2-dehydropantoate 2-reductase [Myxococcota bacterium]